MKKLMMTIVAFCMATCTIWAQNEVSLVVSGEGKDKEEATLKALRSAIEQAYGTFVSSNTIILDDKLVADEIVSLSSGNIQKYEYVNETKMTDGTTSVTLLATVSIDKLVAFAESKGMTAELKGGLFAMNIKKIEFDKQAEEKAVDILCKQLKKMLGTLFDYEIELKDPVKDYLYDDLFWIQFNISAAPNDNFNIFIETLFKTLNSIALSKEEIRNLQKTGYYVYDAFATPNDNCGHDISSLKGYFYSMSNLLGWYFENIGYSRMCFSKPAPCGYSIKSDESTQLNYNGIKNTLCELGFPCELTIVEPRCCIIPDIMFRSSKSKYMLDSLFSEFLDSLHSVSINSGIRNDLIKIHAEPKKSGFIYDFYYDREFLFLFIKKYGYNKCCKTCGFYGKVCVFTGALNFWLNELSAITEISVHKHNQTDTKSNSTTMRKSTGPERGAKFDTY